MEKKLRRSANKMIAGVCGGLAEYLGMDATIVRVIYALLVLFGGVGILLYIILALLMPKAE
jgi:phage shock protein PspC (stress-responsive transcriptional regulator)